VQSNRVVYLAQGSDEAAFHARGRGPVARFLVQHAAHYGEHWLDGAEDGILPFPRVVFQQGDPRTHLADIPVQVERAVRDASSAAGGPVLCTPVVRKGGNLTLAEVREDVKDYGSEREYVRCLGVCLP
jgi:hypothetical protein